MELDRKTLNPELLALLDRSAQLKAEAASLIEQAKKVDREVVEKHCQYSPGDIVTVTGYSHHGKNMRIVTIVLKYGRTLHGRAEFPYFKARGIILRKDDTDSAFEGASTYDINNNPRSDL
jgi:hypothetical protein